MADLVPYQHLIHKINPCDFIGDSLLNTVNTNFCNLEGAFNRINRVGDFKQSLVTEDHDGWKLINTERCLPKNLYPQLECLLEDGLICEKDTSYILPSIPTSVATCNSEENKQINNFIYVGLPIVVLEKPEDCFDPICVVCSGSQAL